MLARIYDKILFALGIALIVASATYFARVRIEDPPAVRPATEFQPPEFRIPEFPFQEWEPPDPISRGAQWVYEVFTPPVIYFNRTTGQFTVTPPSMENRGEVQEDVSFLVRVLKIEQPPYRIQLTAYAGEAPDYLVSLENLETGGLVLAKAGRRYPADEFRLESFTIEERIVSGGDLGTPITDRVGVARIVDDRDGQTVELIEGSRLLLDTVEVTVEIEGGRTQAMRPGDVVTAGGAEYTLVSATLDPQAADFERRDLETNEITSRQLRPPGVPAPGAPAPTAAPPGSPAPVPAADADAAPSPFDPDSSPPNE